MLTEGRQRGGVANCRRQTNISIILLLLHHYFQFLLKGQTLLELLQGGQVPKSKLFEIAEAELSTGCMLHAIPVTQPTVSTQ